MHKASRLIGFALVLAAGCSRASQTADQSSANHKHYADAPGTTQPNRDARRGPRLQKLGTYAFPVSTKNPEAQRFVNQGRNLSYAFNHAESGRAFREAARLDPTLAMAYWGQALVLGPNIHAAMEPPDEKPGSDAHANAVANKANASEREAARSG